MQQIFATLAEDGGGDMIAAWEPVSLRLLHVGLAVDVDDDDDDDVDVDVAVDGAATANVTDDVVIAASAACVAFLRHVFYIFLYCFFLFHFFFCNSFFYI